VLRRRLTIVIGLVLIVGLGILAWPQAIGLQRTAIIANVIAFRGAEIVAALIVVLLLVVLNLIAPKARRRIGAAALLFVLFAIGLGGLMLSRGIGSPGLPAAETNDITILSWNTRGDAVPASEIASLAASSKADVIALPGTTKATAQQVATTLRGEGITMQVFSISQSSIARARSTSLLVSSTLGAYKLVTRYGDTEEVPSVVAEPSGGQNAPVLLAVHTLAPRPGDEGVWRKDLNWVAARCVGSNVVMAGDFNATADHLAGLGTKSGALVGACDDAALASGNGAVGTWPTSLPALVGAPIDHVMATTNWTTSGFQVLQNEDGAGSDHRPVLARLSPAG
jgi:endonuclease/exonuclease/phosphatase (EEP) superfamily protein YafD